MGDGLWTGARESGSRSLTLPHESVRRDLALLEEVAVDAAEGWAGPDPVETVVALQEASLRLGPLDNHARGERYLRRGARADGSCAAFESYASNLTSDDGDGRVDVFVRGIH